MCACDRDSLCPAYAAREAAEWEPDPRDDDERARAAFSEGLSAYDPEALR